MNNFIPVDLQDPDLSSNIEKVIMKHPKLFLHIGSEICFMNNSDTQIFSAFKPLINAVNKICDWSDVNSILFFNFNPGYELIHRDGDREVNGYESWALNIPVLNCADTYTVFYEELPGATPDEGFLPGEATVGYTSWQPHQVKEIERMYFTQPVLFNVSSIHGVYNPTNSPRLSLSLRFKCDVVEKYKISNNIS